MMTLLSALVGFLITLIILSYVFFRDWVLFRIVMYVFIGVAAGYAGAVAVRSVLWAMLLKPLMVERSLLWLVPLILTVLLLIKVSPGPLSRWGNIAVAYLVGVGAAAAVGGAIQGTLLPQSLAAMDAFNFSLMRARNIGLGEFVTTGALMLLGTISTLAYFHFSARPRQNRPPARQKWIEGLAKIGEVFIAVTFGALFAGVYLAAASALAGSMSALWQFLTMWFRH